MILDFQTIILFLILGTFVGFMSGLLGLGGGGFLVPAFVTIFSFIKFSSILFDSLLNIFSISSFVKGLLFNILIISSFEKLCIDFDLFL